MFTGFASENTPAIQVWDFFRPFTSATAIRSVSLPDDCAPVQVFRTGATTAAIRVYLPTAPIEGKKITIVNQRYASSPQSIAIFSSDTSGDGSNITLFTLGQADSIVFVYSKQNITFGTSGGIAPTGWISLNKSSTSAANTYSAIVGGDSNAATSQYCFIGGGLNNTASGSLSLVVGGQSSTASGSSASVVGGSSNTASGSQAAVVGGTNNTASGQTAAIVGGSSNTANQPNTFVFGSQSSTSSGLNSVVLGGTSNIANSTKSVSIGGSYGITRGIAGNFVAPASDEPVDSFLGRSQSATLLLGRQTTDATATVLRSNGSAAGTTNQVILPNNSAYTFQGTVIANITAGGTTSGWKFEGVIKRGANAASTVLVAAVTPTVIAQDAGASAWVVAVTADTTNGGIKVEVTGAAATTIRWVCKIETTEVTF